VNIFKIQVKNAFKFYEKSSFFDQLFIERVVTFENKSDREIKAQQKKSSRASTKDTQ